MTRINVGVDPKNLPSKLLLAEHREITRIPNAILSMKAKIDGDIPAAFTLGRGHVKFFYNKLKFLHKRYDGLYFECRNRSFLVEYKGSSFDKISWAYPELYNDYTPSDNDRIIILQRIKEKGFNIR